MTYTIYTDGAAKGNPGQGGYGTIVIDNKDDTVVTELSGGFRLTTNNRMELLAVIKGLETTSPGDSIVVHSDSKYVVDAFNQSWIKGWIRRGWRTSAGGAVKNIEMWKQLINLVNARNVRFVWVKGHSIDALNERADQLASTAATKEILDIDTEFEKGN